MHIYIQMVIVNLRQSIQWLSPNMSVTNEALLIFSFEVGLQEQRILVNGSSEGLQSKTFYFHN